MTLTARDICWLRFLRRFHYARTPQLREAFFPSDKDGSVTRSRIRLADKAGFVRRNGAQVVDPLDPQTQAPIWALTLKGSAALARATGDVSLLLKCEPSFKDWLSLNHYCALTALHWMVDRAIDAQQHVRLHALYFEHEVADPSATDPAKRFVLYTRPSEGIVCIPDSGMEVQPKDLPRRAIYVEREMGTDTPQRVAAKKHKGYAELAAKGLFKRHFPDAADFRVLCLAPSPSWRDALRAEMKEKPGADFWLFVSTPDLTVESVLHAPIVYKAGDNKPVPLLPPPKAPADGTPGCDTDGRAGGGGKEVATP